MLFEGLTHTVGGERARVTGLLEVGLSQARSVTNTALTESEGTVSDAVYGMQEGFPVEASCAYPVSAGSSSGQPLILLLCTLCLWLVLINISYKYLPYLLSARQSADVVASSSLYVSLVIQFSPCPLPHFFLSLKVYSILSVVSLYCIRRAIDAIDIIFYLEVGGGPQQRVK